MYQMRRGIPFCTSNKKKMIIKYRYKTSEPVLSVPVHYYQMNFGNNSTYTIINSHSLLFTYRRSSLHLCTVPANQNLKKTHVHALGTAPILPNNVIDFVNTQKMVPHPCVPLTQEPGIPQPVSALKSKQNSQLNVCDF